MKIPKLIIPLLLLIWLPFVSVAQVHISGIVRDKESGEVLIGANVYDQGTLNGASTDNNGYFNLIFKEHIDTLLVSFVGYNPAMISLNRDKDTILNIELLPGSNIEEVEIRAFRKTSFNQSKLSNKQLRFLPSIGAEPDVLKSLQLLPGIQTQNEGSSNLLIRGGGPGQNLYLIDNVPLFYVNHVGGFVSVFNPQVLNDVRVFKGGFPAKYGGKLSSVVDITMREGNRKEFKGSAGIGVIGANLTLEGPINDKVSYLISARKTFTEILFGAVSLLADQEYIITYGFYDVNGKLSWRPNYKNSVHANLYLGDDTWNIRLYDTGDKMVFKNRWGNILGSLQWKSIRSSKSSFNNTLSFTRYRISDLRTFEIQESHDSASYYHSNYISSVKDLTLKSEWHYRLMKGWETEFGVKTSSLFFIPNRYWDTAENPKESPERILGLESAGYIENHISLGSFIHMNLGMRAVNYTSSHYTDFSLEPRLDLSLNISPAQTINATYMLGSQYSHMIFTAGSFLSNEVWVPTMQGMEPSGVEQYSLGWKGSFLRQMFSCELGIYKKNMHNLVTYKEGYSNLRGDAMWKSKLVEGGSGESYGAEIFLSKEKGNFTGFLSYSFSHTTRQFDEINQGMEYLFDYDRPHTFSIDLHHKIRDRIDFNVLWVAESGLPYTPAIGRAYLPYTGNDDISYDYEVLLYGERNSARMRPYHRMDVAMHFHSKTVKGRKETWSISVYNLYNRKNPYFYYYNTRPRLDFFQFFQDTYAAQKLYQFSFFPLIPSVSYKVEF